MPDDTTVSVRYLVDDVQAAIDFYSTMFGFEVLTPGAPMFADVQHGNLRLLLSGPMSSAGRPMTDGERPGPGGWNRVHFVVDDLDAEVERLSALGGEFRNEVVEGPAGRQILLIDPAGNFVELFEYAAPAQA